MSSSKGIDLSDQTAIVTGASTGIGEAAAVELARAGADIVVNHRDSEDEAKDTVAKVEALGRKAVAIQADVSKEDEVLGLFDEAERALGPVDIVFSNAGRQKDARIGEMTLDDWNAVIGVNLTGAFLVGREAVRRFRKKGIREEISPAMGKLIFNSSVHQVIPWAFHANYAASKGGIHMLMQSMAQEVANERIRVNAVAPGAIATAINAAERARNSEGMMRLIPYGRVGDPADVGRAVAWLSSDASDYVVGQAIFVDGAMTLYPEFRGNG